MVEPMEFLLNPCPLRIPYNRPASCCGSESFVLHSLLLLSNLSATLHRNTNHPLSMWPIPLGCLSLTRHPSHACYAFYALSLHQTICQWKWVRKEEASAERRCDAMCPRCPPVSYRPLRQGLPHLILRPPSELSAEGFCVSCFLTITIHTA